MTGVVFGAPAGLMLADRLALGDLLGAEELIVMGSAAASLCAWWALGVLGRLADSFGRDGPLRALGTGADTPRAGDRRE